MSTITQQSATTGQIRQISRFGSDAVEKVLDELGLDKSDAQRVIEHGDEFSRAIREMTFTSLIDLFAADKYKDEEVPSDFGYLSGYTKPKEISEQVDILRRIFPLGTGFTDEELYEREVPEGAEGWFAIPRWQRIAPTYAEAVIKVFEAIDEARNGKFHNYHDGQITSKHLRQSPKKEAAFAKLGESQWDYDILLVPAQFGLRHRGRSVRRAFEVMGENEFGLGAFEVGIMLLTHPERLLHFDDLWLGCAGDEFDNLDASDRFFVLTPIFGLFRDDRVEFGTHWCFFPDAAAETGLVSAFLSSSAIPPEEAGVDCVMVPADSPTGDL